MNTQTLQRWLLEAAAEVDVQADHLSALDAALGDGDHGTNMQRGFGAVTDAITDVDDDLRPGELLMLAGATVMNTIGGASGALWGFALRRAGRSLGDAPSVDGHGLADMLTAMADAVVELGEAEPGDKTMLDALAPAAEAMRRGVDAGACVADAVQEASAAARAGADATAAMEARRGRASFLGVRSVGHQDPSANSVAIVMEALATAVRTA